MDKLVFPSEVNVPMFGSMKVPGMTLHEHAALTLRVPDSGDERIDAMIRQANRRDAAVAVMQGLLANPDYLRSNKNAVWIDATYIADALIARLEDSRNG